MGTDVQGSIFFLARDPKHDLEKPYALRFTTSDGFPTTNTQSEEHSGIPIKDLRPLQADLSFEKTGIKIMKTQSSMSYDDFDDESKIQETYLAETARDLKEALGAKRVHIIEHLVGYYYIYEICFKPRLKGCTRFESDMPLSPLPRAIPTNSSSRPLLPTLVRLSVCLHSPKGRRN